MHSEHFRYLLEINRCGSISLAARKLHIRQTTLSAFVKSLETELGFSIFRRTPSGVITTSEGKRLMALAWELDVRCEELFSLKKHSDYEAKPVSVLMCPSINIGLSIPLCQRFFHFDLRGDLFLSEVSRLDIAANITQGTTNIGVTYLTDAEIQQTRQNLTDTGVQLFHLWSDQFYFCTPQIYTSEYPAFITQEEFRQEPLAMVTNFCSGGQKERYSNLYMDGHHITFFPDIALMHQAMLEQNMAGILTGYVFYHSGTFDGRDFHAIPIYKDGSPTVIHVCLLCREERYLRYQERILLNCILNYFSALASTTDKIHPFEKKGGSTQ